MHDFARILDGVEDPRTGNAVRHDLHERLIPLTTAPQDIVPAAGRRIPGGIRVAAPHGGPDGAGRWGFGWCAGAPAGPVAESGRGVRSDQARPPTMS